MQPVRYWIVIASINTKNKWVNNWDIITTYYIILASSWKNVYDISNLCARPGLNLFNAGQSHMFDVCRRLLPDQREDGGRHNGGAAPRARVNGGLVARAGGGAGRVAVSRTWRAGCGRRGLCRLPPTACTAPPAALWAALQPRHPGALPAWPPTALWKGYYL